MIRAEGDPGSPYVANVVPQLRAGTQNVYDYYLAFWFRYGSGPATADRVRLVNHASPAGTSCSAIRQGLRQDRTKVPMSSRFRRS
jgi:hypothetical protein